MKMKSKGKTIQGSSIQYRQFVMPGHTNALGTLFGGVMLSWVDQACAMSAQRHAEKTVVTVHMDDVSFSAPVFQGDQVVVHAYITCVGKSSMEIKAWVFRENPCEHIYQLCLTALLTFVAIDDEGDPSPVPPLLPVNPQERKGIEAAKKRMEQRIERLKLKRSKSP